MVSLAQRTGKQAEEVAEEQSCESASAHKQSGELMRIWGIIYGMCRSVPEVTRITCLFMKQHPGRSNTGPSTALGMDWSQAWGRERF